MSAAQSHLGYHRRHVSGRRLPMSPTTAENDPLLHRVIAGNFRIEKLLGSGAMGNVYKAEQLSLGKAGRGQGAARAPDGRRQAGAALQARGEERLAAEPPELDPDHRLGPGQGRHALHRDGAAGGARSGAGDPRRLPAAAAAHRAHHVAGPVGAGRGARPGGDPPRPQAEQHHADRAARRDRLRQGVRLRHRQGGAERKGRSREHADDPGPGLRHARVHGARAGARRAARRPRRPLRGGGDPVPDGDRRHPVQGRHADGDRQPSSGRSARDAQPPAQRRADPGRRWTL